MKKVSLGNPFSCFWLIYSVYFNQVLQDMPQVYKRSAMIQMRNGMATSTEVTLSSYLKFGMSKLVEAEGSADAGSPGNLVMVSTWERFI
jgi:hypothetical protein